MWISVTEFNPVSPYLPFHNPQGYAIEVKERLKQPKNLKMIISKPYSEETEFIIEEGCYLPQETIDGLTGLCEILKDIRYRLISEGYDIMDGKFYAPDGQLVYERNKPIKN